MTYIDYLKKFEPMDAYILFLLAVDNPGKFNIAEVAMMCHVTQKTVYNCITRHQNIYDTYITHIKDKV